MMKKYSPCELNLSVDRPRAARGLFVFTLLMLLTSAWCLAQNTTNPAENASQTISHDWQSTGEHITLDSKINSIQIYRTPEGKLYVSVFTDQGRKKYMPEQFVKMLEEAHADQKTRGLIFVILNINSWTGLAWVSLGLGGQLLFMSRMILQWLHSEKHGKSVVPVSFWWGSLFGGLMLLTYFIWRRDIVGILGQSTGAFVYARNLMLIYAKPKAMPEPK